MAKANWRVSRSKSTAEVPHSSGNDEATTLGTQETPATPDVATNKPSEQKKPPSPTVVEIPEIKKVDMKPWVEIIQGNRDLNRGMVVEFVVPQLINGKETILVKESDVADELIFGENAIILFALEGHYRCMR